MEKKKKIMLITAIVVLIVFFINLSITRSLLSGSQAQEASYSEFLEELEAKNIAKVQVEDEVIYYTLINDDMTLQSDDFFWGKNGLSLLDRNQERYYYTYRMADVKLVDRLYESGAEFTQVVQKTSIWSMILSVLISLVLPIGIYVFVIYYMTKKMGGGNAMSFGKANAKVYVQSVDGIKFQDVAGEDEAKEALAEIVNYLHNPEKYQKIGASMPKGALLVGPPGTGKTLLAKAVAGEANVPFFSISGSEFVEMFVGMGAAKVRDLFKQASAKAPCIVFIDEIDTIGKKRDAGGITGNDEREQTLNQLLTEMDGFDASKGVVILGACNRPDSLDPALLRPGRFDRRIPVELPDYVGREAILRVHAKKVRMGSDVDLKAIARAASGASGADLANMINEAALRAVREGREYVIQEDLEESIETVLAGFKKKNNILSTKEKLTVAYHEVGHALVAAKQTNAAPVTKITIIPRTSGSLGYTMQVDEQEHQLYSKKELLEKIAVYTGGRAAEMLVFGEETTGAANDIEQATKLARAMVSRYGMSEEFGMVAMERVENVYLGGDTSLQCSEALAEEIDRKVIRIVKEQQERARTILEENSEKLHELAKYLYEEETISGEKFLSILNS
ncbi:MAG: ATP-dependent zinc metalloprotease FtsH [Eubacteriales bacterium]|nr:ATP-dependent zinc metalloprotease FtsH [Eubacteriales bacterium]